MRVLLMVLISLQIVIVGCGDEDKDKDPATAKATLRFSEEAALTLANSLGGFALTLKTIQLVNDVNGKDATNIWLFPECTDSAKCVDSETDYYDMIDVEAVNAVLNSEAGDFDLGSGGDAPPDSMTFKYVRFYTCGKSAQKPIKWSGGSVVDGLADSNFCVYDSVEMSPPLTLSDGSNAIIELSYDLTGDRVFLGSEIEAGKTRASDYDTKFTVCSKGSDDIQWCFDVPPISAAVISE